jgi:hypothetical protein
VREKMPYQLIFPVLILHIINNDSSSRAPGGGGSSRPDIKIARRFVAEHAATVWE